MTVQVINEKPAELVDEGKTEISQEKPFMYTEVDNVYNKFRISSAKGNFGFGSVALVQLLIAAALGIGLWAAVSFGSDEVKQICENLTDLFR